MPSRRRPRNTRTERRLLLTPAAPAALPWAIPTRWLKALIGFFLLGPAVLLTQTFFTSFKRAALEQAFWATEEFWFFALGSLLCLIGFFGSIWARGRPWLLRPYIFGHELTHAIWVVLWGGRVLDFKVSKDGGHILTDTHNFWIALAPYFYPIYALAVILCYGVVSLFYNLGIDQTQYLWMTPLQILFLVLGLTWSFHLAFTCWMIPKGQSDLTSHGTFFSLVVIYLMNLALLAFFLVLVAPELSFHAFAGELLQNAETASVWLWSLASALLVSTGLEAT